MSIGQLSVKHPGMGLDAIKFYAKQNGNWAEHTNSARTDTNIRDVWMVTMSGTGRANPGCIWSKGATVANPLINNSQDAVAKVIATEAGVLRINGLSKTGAPMSEQLTIANGTTPTVNHFYKVCEVYVVSGFSGNGPNTAEITVTGTDGTTIMAHIPAYYGRESQAFFCVPLGYTALVTGARFAKPSGSAFTAQGAISIGLTNALVSVSSKNELFSFDGVFESTAIAPALSHISIVHSQTGLDLSFELEILLIKN